MKETGRQEWNSLVVYGCTISSPTENHLYYSGGLDVSLSFTPAAFSGSTLGFNLLGSGKYCLEATRRKEHRWT